jgi:F-type H+-transporting ATPase subunit b
VNNPLVQPDPGLFIWTIVVFLVLVFLLRRFAWGPLLAALERRNAVIAGAVDDARKAKEELEGVRKDAAELLTQARVDGQAIMARARVDAEQFRVEMKEKAAAEAAALGKNAERQIQAETARALQQIRREAVDLSIAVASKLLHRNISAADNAQLVEDTIRQIESLRE